MKPKPRRKARPKPARRGARQAQAPDLERAEALAVRLPHKQSLRLILVGCGGTGGWLAPHLVRLARAWSEQYGLRTSLALVDPDHVEEKNIWRQNFCLPQIGQNKAEALALRYSPMWGFPITVYPCAFSDRILYAGEHADLTILLGCVDNGKARKSLSGALRGLGYGGVTHTWWIDAANSYASGQILVGSARERSTLKHAFGIGDLCTALPSPCMQHPELLDTRPDKVRPDGEGCADLVLQQSQSLTINQVLAAHTADILNRLVSGTLRTYAAYIDLVTGTMSSLPITAKRIAKVAGCRVSAISKPPR